MFADKKPVLGLAHPYHNPHLAEPVRQATDSAGHHLSYLAFMSPPGFRSVNQWEDNLPVQATMTSANGWLMALKWLLRCDSYVFWGFGHPFPTQTLMIIGACVTGRPVYVASEGLKNPPSLGLKIALGLLSLFGNGQLLAIGNTATKEFSGAGLSWPARLFAFTEHPPGPTIASRHKNDKRPIRLLVVGQLIPRKRVGWLMDQLARRKDKSQIILRISGSGPELEALRDKASHLGLSVEFQGFRRGPDLADDFNESDIFVHPASYEGWGVVLNHALHFGLPILAFERVRSARGLLVQEGVNGYVFRDENEFATQLDKLLECHHLRAKFGQSSKNLASLWTVQHVGGRLGSVIRSPEIQLPAGTMLSYIS